MDRVAGSGTAKTEGYPDNAVQWPVRAMKSL